MAKTPPILLGADVHECIEAIVRPLDRFRRFWLKEYHASKGFEERVLDRAANPQLAAIVDAASHLRSLVPGPMPYWESLVRSAWGTPVMPIVAEEAMRHDQNTDAVAIYDVSKGDLCASALRERVAGLGPGTTLAFSSTMEDSDGAIWHLPMMDFRPRPSRESLTSLLTTVDKWGIPGAVLESGKSYHFYGFKPVPGDAWIRFAAQALLAHPVTDSRYIAHRLLGGSLDLRVSVSPRKPALPRVVAIVS